MDNVPYNQALPDNREVHRWRLTEAIETTARLQGAKNISEVGSMTEIVILVLIMAVIVFLVVMARRSNKNMHTRNAPGQSETKQPRAKKEELDQLRMNKQFWGVEIHQPGCSAATKLTGKQFPIDSAPQLPVEGCAATHCTCHYMGLRNRRTTRRRLTHERRDELRFELEKSDRRSPKDRRKTLAKWRNRD
jgi:hypothetical protein